MAKRIGIMGGTFDPVHLGHTGMARAALEELELEKVILMPAFLQPFKQDRYVTEGKHRIRMLELAAMDSPDPLEVSAWEVEREVLSYTYDTLKAMEDIYGRERIVFILGSDSLMSIDTWYRGKELLKEFPLAVGSRPTNDMYMVEKKARELRESFGGRINLIEKLMLPISSTEIRGLIGEGKPVSGLVSPSVEEYIYEQKLYT